MKQFRITLVVPNFKWGKWDTNTLWHFIPYNLCILAAMIDDSYEVNVLDANKKDLSHEEFVCALKDLNPDIVGITVLMDSYASSGHCAARLVKSLNKGIKVIMGGVYATMNSERAIKDKNVDFVVIGEGEFVLPELIGHLEGKKPLPQKGICYRANGRTVNLGHSELIQDLDKIPPPAYGLIDFKSYGNSAERKSVDSPRKFPYCRIMTSRGCPIGCVFCQVESISGKKFRARSAQNVLDEIQFLKDRYCVESIIFDDDNLFMSRERAVAIFQGMIDKNLVMPWSAIAVAVFKLDEELIKLMRKSGCEYIAVAIESGTERVLKQIIGKPVKFEHAKKMVRIAQDEGIYVAANFIVGFPTETWDEIRQTVKFAEDIDADYLKLYAATPLRNTKLWDICEKEGAFKKDFRESDIWWNAGQIETDEFSANDLTILRAYEWDRINFTKSEKRKRTAKMMGITEETLYDIRRKTLNNANELIKKVLPV